MISHYMSGAEFWYANEADAAAQLYHRIDGPAVVYDNGDKSWWVNGWRHRDDGPAIEWSDRIEYWINGKHIPQLNGKKIYGKENLAKLLMLL